MDYLHVQADNPWDNCYIIGVFRGLLLCFFYPSWPFTLKNFTKYFPRTLCSLGVKYYHCCCVCWFGVFFALFLSLLAFALKNFTKIVSLLALLARTEIIYMAAYKWRSIALILIMQVYKCMQIQIAFRQYK